MKRPAGAIGNLGVLLMLGSGPAQAHDPVFGPGPHVIYQDGVEVHVGADGSKAGRDKDTALDLEFTYGLSADWAAGIAVPYRRVEGATNRSAGAGDIQVFTKYRFWRHDTLGVQESAAVFVNLKTDNGDDRRDPPLGTGTTDAVVGFTYGYESLEWYRWAGVRYRHSGENAAGLQRGDKWLFDLVGGWRPSPPRYREPDTVWMLELNAEYGGKAVLNEVELGDTGGTEVFLSPGIMWTLRNFAVKAGIQLPAYADLNGSQAKSDYRARLELEWHL